MSSKLKRLCSFVSLLRVEPFLLLLVFQYNIKRVPSDQLLQDKICVQMYNTTTDYCHSVPSMKPEDDKLGFKSLILKDTNQFNLYINLLVTIPCVIIQFFIGSWVDKYIHGKKTLMLLGSMAGTIEGVILTWNAIQFDLCKNTHVSY